MWWERAEARNLIQIRRFFCGSSSPTIWGHGVSDHELPHEADVQQVNLKLNESLRACQAMVANYRLMLGGEANDNQPDGADDGNGFAGQSSEAEEA
jgi:hypothetical protein